MKRKIVSAILIISFYLIQVTLGRQIKIGSIMPNFMILLPILFGYINGKKTGMFMGFFAGLLYDIFFTHLFGFSALCFTIIGYVAGKFANEFEENNLFPPILGTLVATFAYEFIIFIGSFLLYNRIIASFFVTRIIIPEIIYTTLIALALYKPFCILNRYLNKPKKKERTF